VKRRSLILPGGVMVSHNDLPDLTTDKRAKCGIQRLAKTSFLFKK
jgi:hypothetical protein